MKFKVGDVVDIIDTNGYSLIDGCYGTISKPLGNRWDYWVKIDNGTLYNKEHFDYLGFYENQLKLNEEYYRNKQFDEYIEGIINE